MRPRPPHLLRLIGLAVVASLTTACTAGGSGALGTIAPPTAGPSPTAVASPSPSGPSRPFRPTPTPAPTFATHVVRAGDTLIALARRFETTPESLAYWNRARYPSLDPESAAYRPDRIEVGWQLAYLPGAAVDPEDLPPAADPGGDPGATATVAEGAFPTLPPDGSALLVARGPEALGGVALTFEYAGGAGEGPGGAAAVAQWLAARGVPATVFVAAAAVEGPDGAPSADGVAVVRRLAGATTLVTGLLASAEDPATLADRLAAGDAALAGALGRSTAPWLRPTGGETGVTALRAAGRAGWRWAIGWDVDPDDGTPPEDGGPIATDIVTRVVARASGGSIVRLQLGGARTLDALPGILDGLAAAGLRVVPLGEVLGLDAGGS